MLQPAWTLPFGVSSAAPTAKPEKRHWAWRRAALAARQRARSAEVKLMAILPDSADSALFTIQEVQGCQNHSDTLGLFPGNVVLRERHSLLSLESVGEGATGN